MNMSMTEKDQQVLERNVMKSLVATVLEKEQDMKKKQKHRQRLPKNYYKDLVSSFKTVIPKLTVKCLKNAVAYQKKKKKKEKDTLLKKLNDNGNPSLSELSSSSSSARLLSEKCDANKNSSNKDNKSSIQNKEKSNNKSLSNRTDVVHYAAAVNEITLVAAEWKRQHGVLTNKSFQNIVSDVKRKRSLPDDFEIKKHRVKRRILRNRTVVEAHEIGGGISTPLAEIEPRIVETILSMSKERRLSLTRNEIVHLVNSSIEGTECQQKLIEFKKRHKTKQPQEQMGRIGNNYVVGFLKRWNHVLASKEPENVVQETIQKLDESK